MSRSQFFAIEELGRVRLSQHFFARDFFCSEIASSYRLPNTPDNPDVFKKAGGRLCEDILEPLVKAFGPISIRSGFRSKSLNDFGHKNGLKCASSNKNCAYHIWDFPDHDGLIGAAACVVIPWALDNLDPKKDWQRLAWWIHDYLPYHRLTFFQKQFSFNIGWHESPRREIYSHIEPKGWLTKEGMLNQYGDHSEMYAGFPKLEKI